TSLSSLISYRLLLPFLLQRCAPLQALHSFPTRRSSDLGAEALDDAELAVSELATNALLHSRSGQTGGVMTLFLRSEGTRLRVARSEEHTSELQSRFDLVCRLLLEKKKKDCTTERALEQA